jgi:xanthine/CO dehydrogenase XdhC/CoxF family maturation factor
VTYDMRGEEDELFGLGIGCNGMLEILLQPLTADDDYAPFPAIAEVFAGDTPESAVVVISSGSTGPAAGSTLVTGGDGDRVKGLDDQWATAAAKVADPNARTARVTDITNNGVRARVLADPIAPVPVILIVGAGDDAVPVVRMAHELGWRVVIADHRPAYLARNAFDVADTRIDFEPGHLSASYNPDAADACVIMTHHLATDRACLAELARCTCTYIGVLGPAARRQRLLDELGDQGKHLSDRLKGPVGTDIGADTPEAIALSILAEVYASLHLAGRTGRRAVTRD